MTHEEQKWFEAARDMFMSEGWKNFMEDLDANIEAIKVDNLDSVEAFWMAKGQMLTLRSLAGYENMVLAAEEQAEEGDYAEDL